MITIIIHTYLKNIYNIRLVGRRCENCMMRSGTELLCRNGGHCVNKRSCECPLGYAGDNCERDLCQGNFIFFMILNYIVVVIFSSHLFRILSQWRRLHKERNKWIKVQMSSRIQRNYLRCGLVSGGQSTLSQRRSVTLLTDISCIEHYF